jgi:hypothetical protein
MKKHLQDQVDKAAAVVVEWQDTIASIASQFETANRSIAAAKRVRETHALRAARGDADAIAEIQRARNEQFLGEQTVGDLKVALKGAEEQLATAKREAEKAQFALAKHDAEILMRERVKVAAHMDALIAEFSAALAEFDKLGGQIVNTPGLFTPNIHGVMAHFEETEGNRRIRSALPKAFLRFFPGSYNDERPRMALEASERTMWISVASAELTEPKAAAA